MKPTAVFVNTSRGPMVDEAALVEALRERRIQAAGIDVYEREPEVHPGLIALDNVVLTPHLGSASRDTRAAIATVVADNVEAFLAGRRPPNVFGEK
jgi:glyoxylate reductase